MLTVSFEDFTGWVNKPFRVISVKDNGNDVMTVTCSEYIPEIYDDSIMEMLVHIDTNLTTNYKPDDVENLTITEQLETLQNGSYNLIAKITWTPPESYRTLELWYRYSSAVSWVAGGTLPKGSTEYYLPCTGNIGDTLYVRVYTVSRLGVRSAGQTTSRILRGDTVPPAAPMNLQGEGGFRFAHITWIDPSDGDLDHIDVYRSITADIAADYEKIGVSSRFSQEYIDNGLGVLQTAWYKLKAVDVAGNESEFSAVISVTSESLPAQEIPEASINESKLLPSLSQKIESMSADAQNGVAITLNALSQDKELESQAIAERTLTIKHNEEVSARELLAIKQGEAQAQIEQVSKVTAGKPDVYNQPSAPSGSLKLGDLWIDSDGLIHRWTGAAWEECRDKELVELMELATAQAWLKAQVSAGGKTVLAGIGLLADTTTGSEITVLANRFYLVSDVDGEQVQPFAVDGSKVLINGNLFVQALKDGGYADSSGWIVGEKIAANSRIQLGSGGQFIAGDGSIFQMGSGAIVIDSENGVLQIRDPNNLTTGNYVRIDTGDIVTYQYLDGAYRPMKSLRKMEVGVGKNEVTVTLPGYWPSQPKIQVSPNALQCYDASYPNQSQQLRCYADTVTYNNGVVTFVPRAYLEIAGGDTYLQLPVPVVNFSFMEQDIPTTVQTTTYYVPAYAKDIVVTGKIYAQDIGGAQGGSVNIVYAKSLKITVKVNFAGTVTTIMTTTLPPTNYDLSTEPTSYYKTFSTTLAGGNPTAQYIYLTADVSYGESISNLPWIYSFDDMKRCWLRFDSIQWTVSSSSKLAEGTLNYVAIAE